jgi:hypothetical protein
MMSVYRNRTIIFVLLLFICVPAYSQASDELFIQKALDAPAKINFRDKTLEEVFAQVGKDLGVTIQPEISALDLLPYGQLTKMQSVQLEGMAWRDALRELLKPLALTYQVGKDRIYILGTRELMRHPRRLNLVELSALVTLQNTRLNDSEDKLLKQIREVSKINFNLIEFGRREEKADKDIAEDFLTEHGEPAPKVLDLYSFQRGRKQRILDATWYVKANVEFGRASAINIEILPAQQILLMKLDRRITVSYRNQPAQSILLDLARQANVEIRFEPGCFSLLDPRVRNSTSLEMQEATIKRAFEALVGITGLEYDLKPDHVWIMAGQNLKDMAQMQRVAEGGSSLDNPAMSVIIMKIPGTEIETMIFVRKEDLEEMGLMEKFHTYYLESVKAYFDFLQKYEPQK